jgi:gamma-glutamylcysteine synthetase
LLLSVVFPANLAEANKRADALALKLEQSEKARKKAESNAAVVEDLRKRLHNAENSLSENITQQTAREEGIISRLESQSRRFVSKCSNHCLFFEYPCFSWRAF